MIILSDSAERTRVRHIPQKCYTVTHQFFPTSRFLYSTSTILGLFLRVTTKLINPLSCACVWLYLLSLSRDQLDLSILIPGSCSCNVQLHLLNWSSENMEQLISLTWEIISERGSKREREDIGEGKKKNSVPDCCPVHIFKCYSLLFVMLAWETSCYLLIKISKHVNTTGGKAEN